MIIRQEQEKDYPQVFKVVEKAFENIEHSDHQEQFLVEKLRKSDAFIPELSIVAEIDNEIVGHILFTKLSVKNDSSSFITLALAPISVKPGYQGQGIGGQLINYGHEMAKKLGYESVILIGHENYYPRFGYQKTTDFGISFPFDLPEENGMALELVPDGLKNVNGMVRYPKEFGID
ncbi:GNAT family N-acetyltransferase [Chryseobacterium sp. T16E-39]|uniref:GNAT family N-acetyltransferase n=1 Tax=Chryseobacterium sp. T16E-39 TaxID=2015076 RepID=UPI000B5B34B1|nr:N-acetyltransferase [Chryseobacterium sp. T16E-39]ASK30237.1 GNAT family N-acetyltransferase [Chryseobacterium sp. T16E-39]